jgi:hypothetical protein
MLKNLEPLPELPRVPAEAGHGDLAVVDASGAGALPLATSLLLPGDA